MTKHKAGKKGWFLANTGRKAVEKEEHIMKLNQIKEAYNIQA